MSAPEALCETVRAASKRGQKLRIVGGETRAFLGEALVGDYEDLSLASHEGVLSYYPAELVVRAKSGTRVADIVQLLADKGQMLAFEPPVHGESSTIGGLVATGLSGARRPYGGAVRDAILGVGLILQDGTWAEFGGQVMKNVAGYDVSRLVCGSHGILGPVTDVSLKVLPAPEVEQSISLEMQLASAQALCASLSQKVSGLSASCFLEDVLYLRFSGSEFLVRESLAKLGGEALDPLFWTQVSNQSLPVFEHAKDIWRLSVRPDEKTGDYAFGMMDWGFAQRWLFDPESDPRKGYQGAGHWTRFCCRTSDFEAPVFQPLPTAQLSITKGLKAAFDRQGIFNPGRMYSEL